MEMSAYERAAWQSLTARQQAREKRWTSTFATWTSANIAGAGDYLREKSKAIQAVGDFSGAAFEKAMSGLYKIILIPVVRSVSLENRLKKARKMGLKAGSSHEFRTCNDLEMVDKRAPRHKYTVALVAESAASSIAITGAEVSTTVSGGATAGVAVGAVAADAASTIAALARAVAEVAAHYGYDPRDPEEERYILGVLNFTTAAGSAAKTAALQELSKLAQQMMRRATMQQLQNEVLVKVINRVFTQLGLRLTRRRLAQAVPIAGILINSGLAVALMEDAVGGAMHVYRLRFLTEKYGLNPEDWTAHIDSMTADSEEDAETIISVEVQPEDLVEDSTSQDGDRSAAGTTRSDF